VSDVGPRYYYCLVSISEPRPPSSYDGPAPGEHERVPPQDLPSEMSVLGSMLLSPEAVAEVLEVLRSPEDFYRPAHQVVFDAVLDLYNRGEPTDAVAVGAELGRTDRLARAGGAPYLHSLVASVPTAANAAYYAGIVADKAVLRRVIGAGTRIVQLGHAAEGASADEVVDQAQQVIYDVSEKRTGDDYHRLSDLIAPTLEELESIAASDGRVGVPTGFGDLDELTNGLHPGQMIVVAARPSVGKSTLGLDFARSCSIRHGMSSALFSLEMSRSEIVMRLLSAEAKVPLNHMRTGRMSDDEWEKVVRRMGDINGAPLFVDDSPQTTMMDIRAKCRRLKQREDLKLVVVDYLQLMSSPKKVESRQQEVSEISRSMKLLAKELEVPVVAISQLNRGSEQRADKRPMMSDLRESGAIEQDADVIILLHREDMYEKESPRAGEADLIVAKHRNGMTRDVTVAFQGHYSRFADLHSTN
jgi:replicative DNA helicase